MNNRPTRVRFAPSPTGHPHIGNIRTALFNWLFARHNGGSFILRIEDTDQARKVEGALESILDSLRWLGLNWDEGPEIGGSYGPYFQSHRLDLYQRYSDQLINDGNAYRCYCSSERLAEMRKELAKQKDRPRSYDRRCRDMETEELSQISSAGATPVVRFKMPLEGQTQFHDLVRGDISFDNNELDDIVILKSDGFPTYHLANIVDDHLMEISHVLRADEWLSSTPRHVLLYRAFGWEPPAFAHLPMILGPDKSKLSKRHGATGIFELREQGYLKEAVINFLALLGWALNDNDELFSPDELVKNFSIERVGKTGAIFSYEKLNWMDGVYIRELDIDEFVAQITPFLENGLPDVIKRPISPEYITQIAPLIQERINTFSEAATYADFFFREDLDYDPSLLIGKKMTSEIALKVLHSAYEKLTVLKSFDHDSLESNLRMLAEALELKAGQVFSPLRVATTGRTAAPPLFETMIVLGQERCIKRIAIAVQKLELL